MGKKISESRTVFAVSDCTGHGIPGALMSTLGMSFLFELAIDSLDLSPATVLNDLRVSIKKALKQTGRKDQRKDGIDMALCIVDKEKKQVQFAGAYNSLYLVRNKVNPDIDASKYRRTESNNYQLIDIKGDRQPIAIHPRETPFTNHIFDLYEGDRLYFSTDGFADQLGKETQFKYLSKRLKNKILEVQHVSLQNQKDIFEKEIKSWRQDIPQQDDILLVGIQP